MPPLSPPLKELLEFGLAGVVVLSEVVVLPAVALAAVSLVLKGATNELPTVDAMPDPRPIPLPVALNMDPKRSPAPN